MCLCECECVHCSSIKNETEEEEMRDGNRKKTSEENNRVGKMKNSSP